VITACGCITLPDSVAVLDPDQAECSRHGWQKIIRKATMPEVLTQVLDIPLIPVDQSADPPF
jgi:hypothetical protein